MNDSEKEYKNPNRSNTNKQVFKTRTNNSNNVLSAHWRDTGHSIEFGSEISRNFAQVHRAFNSFSYTNDLCHVICLTRESTSDNALSHHVMNSQTNITYGTGLATVTAPV